MENEKEMIENYAVEHSVRVGSHRYLFGISTDEKEPHRYMKCKERQETFLAHYDNAIAGNDYVSVMKLYLKDISDALVEYEKELASLGVENTACFKPTDLIPIQAEDDLRGRVVAMKESELAEGCRDISNQLYQIESGYGATTSKFNKSCTAWDLRTGKKYRMYRHELAGIVPDGKIPDFAKKTLEKIKQEKKKDEREDR